jgi:hypothetical protein
MKVYGGPDDGMEVDVIPPHGEIGVFTATTTTDLVWLEGPLQRAAIYVEKDGNLYFDRMETIDISKRA